MKTTLKKFFWLCPLLLLSSTVFAEGIDWAASIMKVEFTKENTEVPDFSCFGYADRSGEAGECSGYSGPDSNCVWEYLDTLGFSDENTNPEITTCFQQAGNYKTTLFLFDFAQNPVDPEISNFVIHPGTPDADQSVFTPAADCSNGTLTANGSDVCTVLFQIKDQFGNPVTQLKNTTGEIFTDTEFFTDANEGDLDIRTGLRLNSQDLSYSTDTPLQTFSISSDDLVQQQFLLTSWTPTTTLLGPYLGKNELLALDLKIKLPQINNDGTVNNSEFVTFAFDKYSLAIHFKPWLRTLLSFINDPEFLLNVATPIKITRNLLLPSDLSSSIFTYLVVHNLPESLSINGLNVNPNATELLAQETIIMPILNLLYGDLPNIENFAFSSIAQYTVNDGSGDKDIKYPSGAIGDGILGGEGADDYDPTPIAVKAIGSSIEGSLIGDEESTILYDQNTIRLGSVQLTDTREIIFQNAFKLSRSLTPKQIIAGGIPFSSAWFDDEEVVLVENQNVIIGASDSTLNMPTGKNTLIIQNGNLVIEGDFVYADNFDSFGFILVNDEVEEYPVTGNVFIRTNVKNMVGTYFTEGGLISNDSLIPTPSNHANGDENNDTQLLLEGTLLAHNTLGGSMLRGFETEYTTPWEKTLNIAEAQVYDLHLTRHYYPIYDTVTPFAQTNTDKCFSNPCDTNQSAFVIRVDGRATNLTPPGFETNTSFGR